MTTLTTLLDSVLQAQALGLRVALPARVLSYHKVGKQADCEIMVKRGIPREDGDGLVLEDFPILRNVAVKHTAGGGFLVHLPLKPGDFVWLHFSDLPFDRYRSRGTKTDPGDHRLHHIGSAFAVPSVDPGALGEEDVGNADDLTIGHFDPEAGLRNLATFRPDGSVRLGDNTHDVESPGYQPVALSVYVLSELNKLATTVGQMKAKFDSHIHTTTATVGVGPALGVLAAPTGKFPDAPTMYEPKSFKVEASE